MKSKKKLVIFFFLLAIVVPFLVEPIKYSNNYDFSISAYKIDILIDDYGDMHVKESITNDYNDRNTVFYKNILYGKNNMFSSNSDVSSLVEDVKVIVEDNSGVVFDTSKDSNSSSRFVGYSYNGDRDELGQRIVCTDSVSACEMIFYYDESGISDFTTFTYEYTIKGVITEYGDISEFNWVLLGYQEMVVNNVEINLTLPEGDYDISKLNTFFHGSNTAKREFVSTNKIKITSKKMVNDEEIEVRLLLNKNTFSGIREYNKVSVNRLDDILAFEDEQISGANLKYNIGFYGSIIVFVILMVCLIMAIFKSYNKCGKEYKSDFYNEYYRELPGDYPPAVMGFLYKFKKINEDDLSATLLDLVRRKYLLLDTNGSNVNEENPNYIFSLNKDKNKDDLSESEKLLVKWFIDDIGDGEKVSLEEIQNAGKKQSSAEKYLDNNRIWVEKVKKEGDKYNFFDKEAEINKNKYMLFNVLFIFGVIGMFFLYSYSGLNLCLSFSLCLLFSTVGYVFFVSGLARRTKAGVEDYVRWKAFKKFLEEFSTFEDYPVPSLIIWEHYLVYATSFGIADKVMDQLKLKFKFEEISNVETTFIGYYGVRYNSIRVLNNAFKSARLSARSTMSISTIKHTSGRSGGFGGGGGFSGGSSFGGGGGSVGGR